MRRESDAHLSVGGEAQVPGGPHGDTLFTGHLSAVTLDLMNIIRAIETHSIDYVVI